MIVLEPNQVCSYGSFCEYSSYTVAGEVIQCHGLDPNRNNVFICELWAENYENKK